MMSEYIKRENAEREVEDIRNANELFGDAAAIGTANQILSRLKHIRAADVVEVRNGYWKDGDEPIIPYEGHYDGNCSICGEWSEYLTDYCPNCGARMDGEEE